MDRSFRGNCHPLFRDGLIFWQFEKFGAGKVFLLFADVAFGTVEGLLVYGMDARYRRGAPGVRDAFSEAFGVKKQVFPVRKGYSVPKTPSYGTGSSSFRRALHRKQPLGA